MRRLLRLSPLAVIVWLAGVFIWVWNGPEDTGVAATSAIVLGAAVDEDVPSPVFAARIDHAIDLLEAGRVQQIVFTGGQGEGDALSEAEAAKRYALSRGVVPDAIITETASRTTMENLVFAQPGNLGEDIGSVLVVSDPLHLRRAMMMADDLGYDAAASPAPQSRYRSLDTQLPFALRELYFIHHYWLFGE